MKALLAASITAFSLLAPATPSKAHIWEPHTTQAVQTFSQPQKDIVGTSIETVPSEANKSLDISQVATGIVALLAVGFVANFAIGALTKDR